MVTKRSAESPAGAVPVSADHCVDRKALKGDQKKCLAAGISYVRNQSRSSDSSATECVAGGQCHRMTRKQLTVRYLQRGAALYFRGSEEFPNHTSAIESMRTRCWMKMAPDCRTNLRAARAKQAGRATHVVLFEKQVYACGEAVRTGSCF
jgi:hypothetical protein